jgi:tetratricopeptide (TPR) repeat protein
MWVRLLALLATAALGIAAGPESWSVARAPHFRVYSDAGSDTARSLAAAFERLHDFFARQLGAVPRGGTVRVIAFATAQKFGAYRTKPGTDAFYMSATGGDYIVMPAGARGDLRVPAHEYAHLLLHSTGWKLPLWIGEGISEVAGTVRISERGAAAGGDVPGRSQLLRTRRWIPMPEFFAARESDDSLFSAQSWVLMDLLLFSPKYAPGFPAFLAMLTTGSSTDTALASVYRTTADLLASDARARLARPNPPVPVAAVELPAASIQLELANGAALLAGLRGTVAFNRGDRAAALAEWKTAIDLGTDDAGLCFRYAMLTEDRAALERTLTLDPSLDDARYRLALIEKSAGHLESAVAHLRKMQTPSGERAFGYWIALGDALLDLGKRSEAKQAFAKAAGVATSDAERKRAAELDWMASTELAVEFEGKQAHTIRVPVDAQPRNPFIESGDKAKSAEATLEHIECGDDGIKVKLIAAGEALILSVPDPSRVQIRNAAGVEFEFTCGPQQGRKVLVEYTATGVLRGLELK